MADTDLPLVHPPMRTDVIGYLACNSVLGFISLVILALRVWGRFIGIGLGPDDWLILAAEASCSLASHISPLPSILTLWLISLSRSVVSFSREYVRAPQGNIQNV